MAKKLISLITSNFYLKVASVLLGVLFWYLIQGEAVQEIDKQLVIEIKTPEGMMVKGGKTYYKDVSVRGSRLDINEIQDENLRAVIEIPSNARTGPQRLRIGKENLVNWDRRMNLVIYDPYIEVNYDVKVTRKIVVKPFIRGVPADGYIIKKTEVTPVLVAVTGLRNEVNDLQRVLTEPIDITGIDKSRRFEIKLNSEYLGDDALETQLVEVNIEIGEEKLNKTFYNIPIDVVGTDFLTTLKPNKVAIEIQGTPGVINFVDRSDLRAFVELVDVAPGRVEKEIQVKIPADTVLIETRPKVTSITVSNKKASH